MQNKTYTFNGTEYTVEKNVLKIQNAWIPLAMYFEDLVKLYTSECDLSKVNGYKEQLKFLSVKEKQDNGDLKRLKSEETPNTELIDKVSKQIELNAIERDKINSEFANDVIAQEQQAEYNRMLGYAIQSLVTSYDVVKGFLNVYLIGDISKLDYENENILEFISEVINDFFLFRMQSK